MAEIVGGDQFSTLGVQSPKSVYSRVFGLAAKAAAGAGNSDSAYSPAVGNHFWLRFVGIWFGCSDLVNPVGGTIYLTFGSGVPTETIIVNDWEIVIPFWAGTTKPAIMVYGHGQYLSFPMNRLFTGESLRFGLCVENASADRPFWVNTWFEISEG